MTVTKQDIAIFLYSAGVSLFGLGIFLFLIAVTEFDLEHGEYTLSILNPSDDALDLQWLFEAVLDTSALFVMLRTGLKLKVDTRTANLLNLLRITLGAIWPFARTALDSSVATIFITVLYLIVFILAFRAFAKVSRTSAYLLIPQLVISPVYIYWIIISIHLNPQFFQYL